ncbi:MAG: hypothetical protein CR982_07865 [Candidatus Cloacimonadota bacterium]|nr:MAG: hypothetical protein CR982_07865 [Candidatus Cloacimonadota bacterium]PIE78282.1 MAG: hypothetical protein CSA15_08675 [Candidatus Delongbacteria bacterium]
MIILLFLYIGIILHRKRKSKVDK